MHAFLEQLQQRRLIWRGADPRPDGARRATGFAALDQRLGGGLPDCGVVEVQTPAAIGELRLLLPALAGDERLLVFIAPPGRVNAAALGGLGLPPERMLVLRPESPAAALWAAEQCLKSGCCGAVLFWPSSGRAVNHHQVRRLQLAAAEGAALFLLLRPAAGGALPASLTLSLSSHPRGLAVAVPRRRGGWPLEAFRVDLCEQWPTLTLSNPPARVLSMPAPRVQAG